MADYPGRNSFDPKSMQLQPYYGPPPPAFRREDFRSYSSSYSYSHADFWAPSQSHSNAPAKDKKLEKSKSASVWGFDDPEFQRKKRVAAYKMYGAQGKVKGSFRKSFRWLKNRYTQVVYGWW